MCIRDRYYVTRKQFSLHMVYCVKREIKLCGAYRTVGDCLENYDGCEKAGSNKGKDVYKRQM